MSAPSTVSRNARAVRTRPESTSSATVSRRTSMAASTRSSSARTTSNRALPAPLLTSASASASLPSRRASISGSAASVRQITIAWSTSSSGMIAEPSSDRSCSVSAACLLLTPLVRLEKRLVAGDDKPALSALLVEVSGSESRGLLAGDQPLATVVERPRPVLRRGERRQTAEQRDQDVRRGDEREAAIAGTRRVTIPVERRSDDLRGCRPRRSRR